MTTLLKTSLFGLALAGLSSVSLMGQVTILEFDFSGSSSTADWNTQSSTFNASNLQSSSMTRGADISNNNANNSFRGTGFSNLGIDFTSDRYFEWTVEASPGFQFTVDSIYGNFNGTATYSNSPGVTMAYAYSLDGGSSFTSMGTFTQVGSGSQTFNIPVVDQAFLTDVTSVVFRFTASGQTPTGGWGLQSAASPGTIGLSMEGTVSAIPEPSTYALIFGSLAFAGLLIRRRIQAKAEKA